LTFAFNVGKAVRRDAFLWLLQEAVDAEVRLDRNFKPLFLAEKWLAELCNQVLKEKSVAKVLEDWFRFVTSPKREQEIMFGTDESAVAVLERGRLLLDQLKATILGRKGDNMRSVVDSVPGWRDDYKDLIKLGFADMPNEDATQTIRRFVLLKRGVIEVHDELQHGSVPFQMVEKLQLRLEDIGSCARWVGRRLAPTQGVLAPAFTFKIRAKNEANSYCCIVGSEDEVSSWVDAITKSLGHNTECNARGETDGQQTNHDDGGGTAAAEQRPSREDEILADLAEQEHTDEHISSTM
jgi:hypothetical protein